MSDLDHKHLDAQMYANTGTRIRMHSDTRVSGAVLEGSQHCFVIKSRLLWQTHCLFLCSPLLSLFFLALSFERHGGPFPHAVCGVVGLTLLHWQLSYWLSLSSNNLLHQQRVSNSKTKSWQRWEECSGRWKKCSRLDWTAIAYQWEISLMSIWSFNECDRIEICSWWLTDLHRLSIKY